MKYILLFSSFFYLIVVNAQDQTVQKLKSEASKTIKKDADTTKKEWKKGGLFNVNLAQASLNNWAAGGEDFSLSVNTILNLFAFYKKDRHSWDNTLDFNLGLLRTTSLGTRKNDDRIDLLSKYGYELAPKWDLAGLFNFRSQVMKGYTYPGGQKTFSSAFLSPAYILLSPGIDFKPNDEFSLFLSPVTARWVIIKDDSIAAKGGYGPKPGSHSRSEIGAFATAGFIKELNKVVGFKSRLDLFSNYKHNPGKIDVFFTNLLSVKLSKVLSATWNLDMIYDDDVRLFGKDHKSAAIQLKSLVGLGLLAKF